MLMASIMGGCYATRQDHSVHVSFDFDQYLLRADTKVLCVRHVHGPKVLFQ